MASPGSGCGSCYLIRAAHFRTRVAQSKSAGGGVMLCKHAADGQANIFTRASHMCISVLITHFQLKHQFTADIIAW